LNAGGERGGEAPRGSPNAGVHRLAQAVHSKLETSEDRGSDRDLKREIKDRDLKRDSEINYLG